MSSQANQVALKKRLMELLKIPENQVCAECGKRGPKWASVVLGVFVCVECSALHKSLGTQLSGTRSVNLDSWSEEQVQVRGRDLFYFYHINFSLYLSSWNNGEINVQENIMKQPSHHMVYVPRKLIVHP